MKKAVLQCGIYNSQFIYIIPISSNMDIKDNKGIFKENIYMMRLRDK